MPDQRFVIEKENHRELFCRRCGAPLAPEYYDRPRVPCPNCGDTRRSVEDHLTATISTGDTFRRETESPEFILKAALVIGGAKTNEGILIQSVSQAWWRILDLLSKDPSNAYAISPRQWEEIIAGAYDEQGFDEVVLTPSSGDHGRDVIATKNGIGSIRIYDQVKAYKPGNLVTANDVRAMLGALSGANVSKGIITTTSTFAPRLMDDPVIAAHVPYRLELKDKDILLPWLDSLRKR